MLILPAAGDGFGEHDARRVHGLEDALLVDSPGDLTDQHGRHALWTQLFMDAEEVDLHHLLPAAWWKKIMKRVSAYWATRKVIAKLTDS